MADTDKPVASGDPERPAGVLVVDKPSGRSSMSIVAEVRRRAGRLKTGHAGTLDPLATGVLVLALGRGTRAIEQLMATEKRYRTEIDLSAFTATDDAEADREPVAVAVPPDVEAVRTALDAFVGTIAQAPPAFSAVKVEGRRAYKNARAGSRERPKARDVVVYGIDLVAYDWPLLTVDIHSGKGFYVRSLARDLGGRLGTGGYCRSIRRTAVGPFTLEQAARLDELPETIGPDDWMTVEEALAMVSAAPASGRGG